MKNERRVEKIITYFGKGVTPNYVDDSSIVVLNQKCIRNNRIDYSFARFIDDTKNYNESKFIKLGDLLINSTGQGTAGRVAFVEKLPEGKKLIVDSHILVLRTNNYYETKCLNFSLFSIEKMLQTFLDGSTGQGEFDRLRLFNVVVNYSLENFVQQKIAAVLSALDDKIELNNKVNAELEAMAKTLYDYWFVQFDFPDVNGKPYKSSGGKMVYNEVLKRKIPDGWEDCRMEKIYEFQYGYGNTNPDNGGIYPIYGSNGVIGNYNEYNNEDAPVIGHIGNNCGSLVYAYGKHYVTYNGVMCKIRMGFDKYFGYAVLLSKDLKKHTRGSSQQFISYDILNSLDVVLPKANFMKVYCKIINPIFDKLIYNKKQNQELSTLRDWLLPMLMNGQVSVGKAYEQVEEVLSVAAEYGAFYKTKIGLE